MLIIIDSLITARTKLESGPAAASIAAPYSPYLTLSGLNGTGLAARIGTSK